MEIDKIIIKQELLGYYFYFTRPPKKNLNNMSYIIPNSKKKESGLPDKKILEAKINKYFKI